MASENNNLLRLRELLLRHFTYEELIELGFQLKPPLALAFDQGLWLEAPGAREILTHEIINHLHRFGQMDEFISQLHQSRPAVNWSQVYELPFERDDNRASDRPFNWGASDGPDLAPSVGMDEFRQLWFEVRESQFNQPNRFGSQVAPRSDDETLSELSEDSDSRRMLYWSIRIFQALRDRYVQILRMVPGLWQVAVGLFDPVTEGNEFGVIALTLGDAVNTSLDRELIYADYSEGTVTFRLIVRPISIEEQAFPSLHPTRGTASCWARSRISTSALGPGILTAKHVAGTTVGAPVKFSGAIGHVLDVAPEGIDAALVDSPESVTHAGALRTRAAVAPWSDAQFIGTASGSHTTKVTATTDQLGILNSPAFPVRILLADHGQPGDSGALVREVKNARRSRAIGLYMAKYTDKARRTGGLAQHLHQAVEIMDMELYE